MLATVRRALTSLILAFHFHCHLPVIEDRMPKSAMVVAWRASPHPQTLIILILICNYIY